MRCFNCDRELDGSREHILLDSLGGRLTSKDLVCRSCNSKFGTEFDHVVFEQLQSFAQLLGVNSRSRKSGIKMSDETGKDADLDSSFIGKSILDYPNENGELVRAVFNTEKQYYKFIENLKRWDRFKGYKLEEVDKKYTRFPTNKHSKGEKFVLQVDKLYKRHFFKVGIEFYLFNNLPIQDIDLAIKNFRNNIVGRRVFEYQPSVPIYEPKENEISHLLYLKVDGKKGLIYCLTEYFNFTSTITVLNDNYKGNTNKTFIYCYDVISKEKIDIDSTRISLDFNNTELRHFQELLSEGNPPNVARRFHLLWDKVLRELKSNDKIK